MSLFILQTVQKFGEAAGDALSIYICKTMDMPAYHTLHVLQDVQIENQHKKKPKHH